MPDLRLEQRYRDDSGAPHGSLLFRVHHLGGEALAPDRLCYAATSRPAKAAEVVGGENRLLFKSADGTLNAWVMDQDWNRTGSAGTYEVDSDAWRTAEIEYEFDADEDVNLGS